MTPEFANAIYDILVKTCGAREADRAEFVLAQTDGVVTEWRFCGHLGFGGKFWRNGGRIYVSCYPEDMSPKRKEILSAANIALATLNL
jgi:hypothetical protein